MARAKIEVREPIIDHIPVTCTKSQKARYQRIAGRLEAMSKPHKKILNEEARVGLEKAMNKIERMLDSGEISA
ncbi:MAG: hypothetical protein C4586_05845 [Anaerolineaceae bacterium]|jgi:hypothetical protein|nr:MAG: hypothetical protein C4586_05845 [Anaerolineaceae bacterium]